MKSACSQIFADEVAMGLHRELAIELNDLLCLDRPLSAPPRPNHLEPEERMWRALLRYSIQSRAYAVRKLLQSRLCIYH